MRTLKRLALRFYRFPGPTLNTASERGLRSWSGLLLPAAESHAFRALNVGGGGRPLPPRAVNRRIRDATLAMDIRSTPQVRVVGDALALPFADASFDGALPLALLEHVSDSRLAVSEMSRVLKPGGLLYCEVPFLQVYHPSPDDYLRFTASGLRRLCAGFEEIELGVCVGPSSALSWVLRAYLVGILTGFSWSRRARRIAEFFAAWLTFPVKYLDLLVARRPAAAEMASAFYFLGRKA